MADYLILGVLAVWFLLAVRSIIKHRGGCSCGSASSACTGICASCNKDCVKEQCRESH